MCERCVLTGVSWLDNSGDVFTKTGINVTDSADINIPNDKEITGRQYVSPDVWYALPADEIGGYWSFDMRRVNSLRIMKVMESQTLWKV
jgi:hypothetical protein